MTDTHQTDTDNKMMRAVSLRTDHTGASAKVDELGERRILAGFDDINRFYEEHGYAPVNAEGRDIFERILSIRLCAIISLGAANSFLEPYDKYGIL